MTRPDGVPRQIVYTTGHETGRNHATRVTLLAPIHSMRIDSEFQFVQGIDIFVPRGYPALRASIGAADRNLVVIAGPGRDLADQVAGMTGQGTSADFDDYDFVAGLRAILWAISAAVLSVGLLAFAVSGIDRALARRRELASLQVLGTPPALLRQAQGWEAALPTGVGAVLAIGSGWLAGLSYLRLADSPVVPWTSMGLLALCALAAAALVAGLTVVATNVRLTPDVIRTE